MTSKPPKHSTHRLCDPSSQWIMQSIRRGRPCKVSSVARRASPAKLYNVCSHRLGKGGLKATHSPTPRSISPPSNARSRYSQYPKPTWHYVKRSGARNCSREQGLQAHASMPLAVFSACVHHRLPAAGTSKLQQNPLPRATPCQFSTTKKHLRKIPLREYMRPASLIPCISMKRCSFGFSSARGHVRKSADPSLINARSHVEDLLSGELAPKDVKGLQAHGFGFPRVHSDFPILHVDKRAASNHFLGVLTVRGMQELHLSVGIYSPEHGLHLELLPQVRGQAQALLLARKLHHVLTLAHFGTGSARQIKHLLLRRLPHNNVELFRPSLVS